MTQGQSYVTHFAMSSTPLFVGWKRAFSHAKDTEAEGAKYFEGFFKRSRRGDESVTPQEDPSNAIHTALSEPHERKSFRPTYSGEVEKEDVERGGFCQPASLASFFQHRKGGDAVISHLPIGENDQCLASASLLDKLPDVIDRGNGMARQICRAWLKNTFLQLGQPCKNLTCERRHLIESKSIGLLYKDYSFKGLTAAQRNSIIIQVQAAATTATTATTTTPVTATIPAVISATVCEALVKESEASAVIIVASGSAAVVSLIVPAETRKITISSESPPVLAAMNHVIMPKKFNKIVSNHDSYTSEKKLHGSHSAVKTVIDHNTVCSSSSKNRSIISKHEEVESAMGIIEDDERDEKMVKTLDTKVSDINSSIIPEDLRKICGVPICRLRDRIRITKKPWMPIHKKITY